MANPNPAAALLNQPPPTATRKSVTGFVTKLVGDGATYGFINDEIFFQQTNVADGPAGVNDRVFADCEYSEHLPIKWNATSIKILNRASSSSSSPAAPSQQQPIQTPACNILESDPRRQSRQGMLLSQQQQQQQQQQQPQQQASPAPVPQMQQVAPPAFAPAVPTTVANSYQQHRQQKQQQQQQQHLQHDVNMHQQQPPPPQQMQPQLPMGMMDPSMNRAPDFFSPFNQPPPQAMPQHPVELQPFGQHDTPMGPPKLEYTSQLGSAFVQNQFMPGPMLSQPPPPQPMLPQQLAQQQQQQQQQQQRSPHQQNQRNQNQNMNMNNNNNNNSNKGRFNDTNKNMDRNQMNNNRGRNRNDKFEQSRVGERENSNSRQSRNSRERSSGRVDGPNNKSIGNSKRDNSNSRQSPQSHNARSTASISSDRGHNKSSSSSSSKRYEPYNIPKSAILHNMNSWNMRSRCSSAIHVPSDLKNVIVNSYLRLDVKNMPKPLKFKIESCRESEDKTKENENDEATKKTIDVATGDDDQGGMKKVEAPASDSGASEESSQVQVSSRKDSDQHSTPPSSKSDTRLNHKYGVKVVLISLPELENIYKKVFGPELNSFTSDAKSHPRLDEAIEMLCNRGPNGGHSLIGGKFDPTLDGFMEGEVNEFERHGRQPDLIATCKRVVSEQTGLDLGPCQGWTLVATFIYNNKSDYFSSKASIEYSYIYMPHIWTLSEFNLDDSLMEKESIMVNVSSVPQDLDVTMTEENANADTADEPTVEVSQADDGVKEEMSAATIEPEVGATTNTNIDTAPVKSEGLTVENLSELKVADLKAELDKRGVVYKPSLKKADLVALLQANLSNISQNTESSTGAAAPITQEPDATVPLIDPADQLEEGEVATEEDTPDQSEENTLDASDAQAAIAKSGVPEDVELAGTLKRKVDEVTGEFGDQQQAERDKEGGGEATKKMKIKEDVEDTSESCKKVGGVAEKVYLIMEPFVVRARKGQQLATVSLYDAAAVSRYDQFELSVASHILKEALIQHLSEYIFTTLVEENRSKSQATGCDTSSISSSSTGTSQETHTNNCTSDTNNNSSNASSKNQAKSVSDSKEEGNQGVAKEYPVDRYITLAFSYFDSTHKGYLHSDDLSKLLNNTGITISKRALMSLLGDSDKFNYRTLADLSPVKFAPTHVYKFPEQFNRLPSSCMGDDSNNNNNSSQPAGQEQPGAVRTVEYQGVRYEVEKLIQQVREAETVRVNMVERFNRAIENFDKQAEEIHVLEVSRMSLSKSIKSINDELSEVRRSRDVAEKKLDSLKAKLESMLTEIQQRN